MELCLDPCSTIHESTLLNVLNKFLQCMLHCTHFLHLIEQLVLEHVCHGQLFHLDKNNICSCTSASVWKILLTRIRKSHKVVLSLNTSLSQQVSYWCIIHIHMMLQAQSIIFPSVSQYMYQSFNCTLPGFDVNFDNLCTAKLKSTLVDNK